MVTSLFVCSELIIKSPKCPVDSTKFSLVYWDICWVSCQERDPLGNRISNPEESKVVGKESTKYSASLGVMVNRTISTSFLWFPESCIPPIRDKSAIYRSVT